MDYQIKSIYYSIADADGSYYLSNNLSIYKG